MTLMADEDGWYRYQNRRGSLSALTALNEIPRDGELIDVGGGSEIRIGDGVTHFNDLEPYRPASTFPTLTSFVTRETPTGDTDGTNTAFAFAFTPVAGSEMVFLDGLLQEEGDDYTANDTDITFTTAPTAGAKVRVTYRKIE